MPSDWFLPVFISHDRDTARGALGIFQHSLPIRWSNKKLMSIDDDAKVCLIGKCVFQKILIIILLVF